MASLRPLMPAMIAVVLLFLLSLAGMTTLTLAFQPLPSLQTITFAKRLQGAVPTAPLLAGFGGGVSDSKKKKQPKEKPLKPKQQWDRYSSLKTEARVRVAVRESEDADWLEVGRVRSKDNQQIAAAVARQRALIAEHARRLFPMQASNKQSLQWAYFESDESDSESDAPSGKWVAVDKSVLDKNLPEGFEKMIGFEGQPDPASGFYCSYKEGRLVE